jgi:hypothetical protein
MQLTEPAKELPRRRASLRDNPTDFWITHTFFRLFLPRDPQTSRRNWALKKQKNHDALICDCDHEQSGKYRDASAQQDQALAHSIDPMSQAPVSHLELPNELLFKILAHVAGCSSDSI